MSRKYFLDNAVEYYPDSGELLVDGRVENLQSLENKLLLHFVTHQNQLVSKEQLYEIGWEGRIYGDNPLSKAISNLRGKLNDSPKNPSFIKTIPKKGFRFISNVSEQPLASEPQLEQPSSKLNKPIIKGIIVASLAVIASLILVNTLFSQDKHLSVEQTGKYNRITNTEAYQERDPDISANGKYIVYSRKISESSPSAIFAKILPGGKEVALSDNELNNNSPKWHKDSQRILYHRFTSDHCNISLMELNEKLKVVTDRILVSCSKFSKSLGLSWGPGQTIFYTDSDIDRQFAPQNIYQLDIASGKRSVIANSNANDGRGFYRVHYDSQSNQLFALLSTGWVTTQVVSLDLHGNIKQRHNVDMPPFSISSYEGMPLFRSADNHIRYLKDGKAQLMMLASRSLVFSPDFNPNPRPMLAFVEGSFNSSQLIQLDLPQGKQQVLANESAIYRYPVMSASNNLYYVSNQSGVYQVWLQNSRKIDMLSEFQDHLKIETLAISKDERYAAVNIDGHIHVYMMDNLPWLNDQPFMRIENSINPHFSPDGQSIWVSLKEQDGYQLQQYSLADKKPTGQNIKHGFIGLFDGYSHQHLVFKDEQKGIWKIENGKLKHYANTPLLMTSPHSVSLHNNILTYYDDHHGDLKQINLTTGQQTLLSEQAYRYFTPIPDQPNQWIGALRRFGNTDIFIVNY